MLDHNAVVAGASGQIDVKPAREIPSVSVGPPDILT